MRYLGLIQPDTIVLLPVHTHLRRVEEEMYSPTQEEMVVRVLCQLGARTLCQDAEERVLEVETLVPIRIVKTVHELTMDFLKGYKR